MRRQRPRPGPGTLERTWERWMDRMIANNRTPRPLVYFRDGKLMVGYRSMSRTHEARMATKMTWQWLK